MVGAPQVGAAVITGPIDDLPESSGMFWWGDGANDLGHEWSTAAPETSGWFYASYAPWSTVDVYVYARL